MWNNFVIQIKHREAYYHIVFETDAGWYASASQIPPQGLGHSFSQMLVVLLPDESRAESLPRNCPLSKASPKITLHPQGRLHTMTDLSSKYKFSQVRTFLKRYSNYRVPYGIIWRHYCDYIVLQFVPLPNPTSLIPLQVLTLQISNTGSTSSGNWPMTVNTRCGPKKQTLKWYFEANRLLANWESGPISADGQNTESLECSRRILCNW